MHIAYVKIANFRKLLSVRIDLSKETTLFVGANNSGKTSAILALRRFLVNKGKRFRTQDFTLSHWSAINAHFGQQKALPDAQRENLSRIQSGACRLIAHSDRPVGQMCAPVTFG